MRIASSIDLAMGVAVLFVALAAACPSSDARAQVQANEADFAAAASATARTHHGFGTPGGGVSRDDLDSPRQAPFAASENLFLPAKGSAAPLLYPGDLTNHGGAVLKKMVSHPIFLDGHGVCPSVAACWGDPATFLKALGDSAFIHVVDQYVGTTANGRYTVTAPVTAINPALPSTPLTDSQIQAIVHAVAATSAGTGYTNMYEVFLTPGTDICFDATYSVCYSPDNPATFQFCAYHGSVTFGDIGHVIYSVQPYVGTISGCEAGGTLPNGELTDSTNSVLAHEVIEAITDPDGNAWWNSANNSLYGSEIEDECMFLNSAFMIVTSAWTSDSHKYATQQSYLNSKHGCGVAP